MMNRKEKIIVASETYLNTKPHATARQISSFLSDSTISFPGGEPTPAEVGGILSRSYKFDSKQKGSTRYYGVKK